MLLACINHKTDKHKLKWMSCFRTIPFPANLIGDTLSSASLKVFCSSSVTSPTTLHAGSLRALICFLATTSKACPGVNSPILTPAVGQKVWVSKEKKEKRRIVAK